MMNNRTTQVSPIQSVQRATSILFTFSSEQPVLSAAQIAHRLDLNRTTAWRYLVSLSEVGLVRQLDGEPAQFALGSRVLSLAELVLRQMGDLTEVARPVLVELRDETQETAALHVRQGWSRIVVTQVESRHELRRTYGELGDPIPMQRGAPGLGILAWLSHGERLAYLSDVDASQGAKAALELETELKRSKDRGYAVSIQARTPGVASIAAPVMNASESVAAAVNISGPMERITTVGIENLSKPVIQAAATITNRLRDRAAT